MPIVYAYDIEPPLARKWKAPQVISHDRSYFPAFMLVYGSYAWLYIKRASRLDFDKAQDILFPAD